ncbi:hypothetical protein SSEA_SKINNY_125 [Mycobacterium phage Skinny]|uniref:Uncharacterized protein n=6 Tax=Bongovirus bongo TaxID=1983750 RepID=A0A0M4S433_9CAUD|nr:hypothetical protein PEGLEG_123 [Mycobacterium phage PegLeg]YP_009604956.1 hypothetical protein FDH95_gp125 [Mycobacterium phage Bongo]ALF00627.1 hypothetical protein SEA_BRICOLE_121 [Mycobacterium phage Bricole]AXQ52739.1 hypothetical protein SEA_IPHANE7_117 [Mycobacterium phage IPhane7]QDH93675.1 hypothetical protein SEA_LILHOMIEP_119 [Mycobacterium phage LilhomieP]QGJ93242.1 hypothetical protein SEA_TYDAWG_114 [Mycobacterium phage TyDawg]QUU29304.1 hypothetical protein [Mycobacterium ph
MTLTVKLLGFEVVTLELDITEMSSDAPRLTPVDKSVKGLSNWWVRRMNK